MDALVNLICSGQDGFTPVMLVRLFVFVMTLECIAMIARAVMSLGKR